MQDCSQLALSFLVKFVVLFDIVDLAYHHATIRTTAMTMTTTAIFAIITATGSVVSAT